MMSAPMLFLLARTRRSSAAGSTSERSGSCPAGGRASEVTRAPYAARTAPRPAPISNRAAAHPAQRAWSRRESRRRAVRSWQTGVPPGAARRLRAAPPSAGASWASALGRARVPVRAPPSAPAVPPVWGEAPRLWTTVACTARRGPGGVLARWRAPRVAAAGHAPTCRSARARPPGPRHMCRYRRSRIGSYPPVVECTSTGISGVVWRRVHAAARARARPACAARRKATHCLDPAQDAAVDGARAVLQVRKFARCQSGELQDWLWAAGQAADRAAWRGRQRAIGD